MNFKQKFLLDNTSGSRFTSFRKMNIVERILFVELNCEELGKIEKVEHNILKLDR